MIALKHEMSYRLKVTGPLAATEGSSVGAGEYWEMTEGTLTGERIKANAGRRLVRGRHRPLRPSGRACAVRNRRRRNHPPPLHRPFEKTDAFKKAAEAGTGTDWPDPYMRMATRFDTGAEKYRWLNESLFIAEGRLAGPREIEYRSIYRVL